MFQLEVLDETILNNQIPRFYRFLPVGLSIILFTVIGLCIVFATTMLVLFLCNWRQPEVQASSRMLSLCIFLGCYLLLSGALGNIINVETTDIYIMSVCVFTVCSATIGVDLILVTVSLWNVFGTVGWYEACLAILAIGYTIVAVMCQVFLIVPKITPGLKRNLKA